MRVHAVWLIILSALLFGCARPSRDGSPTPAPATPASAPTTAAPATTLPAATLPPTPIPTAPPALAPTHTPPPAYTPGDYVEILESGGQTRRYRLHVPPGYLPDEPMPLVINLHGLGSSMEQQALLSGTSDLADREGFLVVYPQGSDVPRMWHAEPSPAGQDDVRFIRELVAHLHARLSIDPDRIYAAGFSNGGGMAHRLACDLSDVIAAAGSVSGAYLLDQACAPRRPVPIIAFHGTADPIVPYGGQGRGLPPVRDWAARWAARNGCAPQPVILLDEGSLTAEAWGGCDDGADVVLYTVEGGGHTWLGTGSRAPALDATRIIWDFFSAHPQK